MGGQHLFCTVCEGNFDSKKSWNEHLLEERHQRLVREACSRRWWEDEHMRQCCVVVFSSVPVTPQFGGELISEFSKPVRVYVTDFVRWEEKPNLALIQFESRALATKICCEGLCSNHTGGSTTVNGHRVQLKTAGDYMELEWKELVPQTAQIPESAQLSHTDQIPQTHQIPQTAQLPRTAQIPQTAHILHTGQFLHTAHFPQSAHIHIPRTALSLHTAQIPQTARISQTGQIPQMTAQIPHNAHPPPPCLETSLKPLLETVSQQDSCLLLKNFEWISKSISYSPSDLTKLGQFQARLKAIVNEDSCVTVLLGNQYLGLRSTNSDVNIMLYWRNNDGFTFLQDSSSLTAKQLEITQQLMADLALEPGNEGCPIHIFHSGAALLESRVCELVAHLCKFDSRLKPVLTLVTFWSNYHQLKLEYSSDKNRHGRCSYPMGFHILTVLFFMTQHLIPSTKELASYPHQPIILDNIDVGFAMTDDVIQEWKKVHVSPPEQSPEWIESVVKLTHDMFLFYSTKMSRGRWLWSCYDGLILTHLECEQRTQLTGEHWSCGSANNNRRRIFVTHPFHRSWRLSVSLNLFDKEVSPKMMSTVALLNKYLKGGFMSLSYALAGGPVDINRVKSWATKCPLRQWSNWAADLQ